MSRYRSVSSFSSICFPILSLPSFPFFFFNDTATTEIYTLSLHDALPICPTRRCSFPRTIRRRSRAPSVTSDRKSTRLNSSHGSISYAVFCLKKKKKHYTFENNQMNTECGAEREPINILRL